MSDTLRDLIHIVVVTIELLAVLIIGVGLVVVLALALRSLLRGRSLLETYHDIRQGLGRVLLLGLEVLIAADIIATVALDFSVQSVGALGLIVLIRTFLSWAIEVETDGHWPWQAARIRAEAENNHQQRNDDSQP